ncbi:hypothetical protein Hanom_Chr09g00793631 [Helianthus anomalus]
MSQRNCAHPLSVAECTWWSSRPTADISDVLPPTQSNMGNLANHPSILAVLSNNEFSCVIATPYCIISNSKT